MAAVLILVIAGVDFWTGREIGVSLFYLIPIALITWQFSNRAGYVACVVCAGTWFATDALAGVAHSHSFIPVWNMGIRLGFFSVTACLLMTLKRRLEDEQQLALTDGLTDLYNARAFKQRARELISLSRRHDHPMALVYLDLDNFKRVNDRLGHAEGDAVLCMVGATLKTCMRASDIVARIGGDEFVIAMPETATADARAAVTKMHRELVSHCASQHWPVGFSVGVAVFITAPPSLEEALGFADRLMYRVKQTGKNAVVVEEYLRPMTVPPPVQQSETSDAV